MKIESGKWRALGKIFCVGIGLLVFAALFVSCSDGSSSDENLETYYGYSLNYNDSYHRVIAYNCVETSESNVYDVKTAELHFFSVSNSNYTDRTGKELCDMIRTNAVSADSSIAGTQSSATTATITGTSGTVKTFNIPAGMSYTMYYYF